MALGGLIGRKLGMTQVYTPQGVLVPVTVIQAGPCTVVATVPARRAASWLRTAACRRCSRTGPATTAAGTSTCPAGTRLCETTGSVTVPSATAYVRAPGPLRTTTVPPRAPGTAPRTRRR